MRKGEILIFVIIVFSAVVIGALRIFDNSPDNKAISEIPFYSLADKPLKDEASLLIRNYKCRDCHSLWAIRDIMQAVPAPMLDGIGTIRDEEWLYDYLSSDNPQSIIPSRLKKEYQMPSYRKIPDDQRKVLAKYLSSLRVKTWYEDKARKAECEKLTGKEC